MQEMIQSFNWANDGTTIRPEAFVGRRLAGTVISARLLEPHPTGSEGSGLWKFIFEADLTGLGFERRYQMTCWIGSFTEAQGLRYRYTFMGLQEDATNAETKGKVEIKISLGRSRMSISADRIPLNPAQEKALQENAQLTAEIHQEIRRSNM
jgi:hypothetical protein